MIFIYIRSIQRQAHSIQADDGRKKHSTKIMAFITGIAVILFNKMVDFSISFFI